MTRMVIRTAVIAVTSRRENRERDRRRLCELADLSPAALPALSESEMMI